MVTRKNKMQVQSLQKTIWRKLLFTYKIMLFEFAFSYYEITSLLRNPFIENGLMLKKIVCLPLLESKQELEVALEQLVFELWEEVKQSQQRWELPKRPKHSTTKSDICFKKINSVWLKMKVIVYLRKTPKRKKRKRNKRKNHIIFFSDVLRSSYCSAFR